MELNVISKVAAAALPAHARPSRLAPGWSRIGFGSSSVQAARALVLHAGKGDSKPNPNDDDSNPNPNDDDSNPNPPNDDSEPKEKRVDRSEILILEGIRQALTRQEDNIIFSLLERAQYRYNANTYDSSAFHMDDFDGSLVEYIVRETKKLHAKVDLSSNIQSFGRYMSPDEHSFFPEDLSEPLLPPIQYPKPPFYKAHTAHESSHAQAYAHPAPESNLAPQSFNNIQADGTKVLHPAADSININKRIWQMYFDELLPILVKEGDDGNYGSTAVCDTICLQALPKRTHYGKFVAEAKFQESPEKYIPAIIAQDREKIMELLTFVAVERVIENRVQGKAQTFGQEVKSGGAKDNGDPPVYKIRPSLVAELYTRTIMPLTKEVQVEHLLRRLD